MQRKVIMNMFPIERQGLLQSGNTAGRKVFKQRRSLMNISCEETSKELFVAKFPFLIPS